MSTPEFLAIRRSPGGCPSRAASSRQKPMTFQCLSERGQTPTSWAIASPTCGVHSALSVRNPSSLVWTASPAYSRVGMHFSFLTLGAGLWLRGGLDGTLPGHRHTAGDRYVPTRQEQVPIRPLEEELSPMIAARLLQEWHGTDDGQREDAGQWLGLVVEVNQEGLSLAALDEAVGVAVKLGQRALARDHPQQVLLEDFGLEVCDRAGLGGRQIGRVAQREDVVVLFGRERVGVRRHEAHFVAEARLLDEGGSLVRRDRHEQVVGDPAVVIGDELPALRVHLGSRELRLDGDAFLLQQRRQKPVAGGPGERAVQRRRVHEVHAVADAAAREVVVGEEEELEGSDRALDRHLDDVDDEAASGKARECR